MTLIELLAITGAITGLAATVAPSAAATTPEPSEPYGDTDTTLLATFGSGLGSGSAVGPDGALYVTDGNAGSVWRIDTGTGAVTSYAEGLPTQVIGIGGAMDVAFYGDTAYVLVTLVGGDIVGGDHIGDDAVGIYRLEDDGSFTVVADLGAWSIEHPPTTDHFITTGVQYALEAHGESLLVTDGHHNRVLSVTYAGEISEVVTADNVVPTGLATSGGTMYLGLAGPLPHLPADGQVAVFDAAASAGVATPVASGASMIVDVEVGGDRLFALSQGDWDGVQEGSPASPDTGRLMTVGLDGTMTPVTGRSGEEIVLDRPTSLELIGGTAYVVTLAGEVYSIADVVASSCDGPVVSAQE